MWFLMERLEWWQIHRRWSLPGTNSVHYDDVTMSSMASQFTGDSIACLAVFLDKHQRKHQSPRYWSFVRESTDDRWFPSQRACNAETDPFDDVIRWWYRFPFLLWRRCYIFWLFRDCLHLVKCNMPWYHVSDEAHHVICISVTGNMSTWPRY